MIKEKQVILDAFPVKSCWLILAISLAPFAMMVLGADFGSVSYSFDIDEISKWDVDKAGIIDEMFYALTGGLQHGLLEWSSVMLAFFTIILALAHFAISKDITTPIIGVALFCSGMMDAFHTLAAMRLIDVVADNSQLIPFTWALSRGFHAAILIVGILICLKVDTTNTRVGLFRISVISCFFAVIAYSLITYAANSLDLPQTQFPDALIVRPYDIVPLVLFILTVFIAWKLYKKVTNVLSASLVIALIPEIILEAHMAFGSRVLFDSHFNIAHGLKILAYFIPLMALVIGYIRTYQMQEKVSLALEQSNKELDEFAYVASHDLKAPLRVIDNAGRWLEEDFAEHLDEDGKENMQLLRNRTIRMEKLLDDLLEYSRIGRKTDERYTEKVTGSGLMHDVLLLVEKPDDFTINVSPNFANIGLNLMPIQQIFVNLINNAIKHHDKYKGTINVTVEEQGNQYIFSVEDDGPGIPAEFREQVFKMFQTLKPRDRVEGSGMGLAMVQKHLEYIGGTITLKSTEGKGTTFRFTWPKRQRINTL